MMILEPYAINQIVKQMHDVTERPFTAEEEHELERLRATTMQGRMADNADIAALRALRMKPIDIDKRRTLIGQMNANPLYAGYRFRLLNGRIVAERMV